MKILYVVSNINTASQGVGGHYYSMLATSEALSRSNEITILNIGTEESLALKSAKNKVENILDANLNTIKLLYQLKRFLKKGHFDAIHVFDDLAYFYIRVANLFLKTPIVLTKCGGINPQYFPFCRNIIFYSKENLKFFSAKKKYAKTRSYYIPNRVNPFKQDKRRIASLSEKHELERYDIIFTRISRVGTTYKNSLKQLIDLAESCNLINKSACVLIIGTVVDKEVFNEIQSYSTKIEVFLETDPYYTSNAKELIDIGHVFLGTGRSFMEAALSNKIMLAPLKHQSLPILVNENNFEKLFETNFSERGDVYNFDQDLQKKQLEELLNVEENISSYRKKLFPLFDKNFSINQKVNEYEEIYRKSQYEVEYTNLYDVILNYLFVQRRFFISKKLKKQIA